MSISGLSDRVYAWDMSLVVAVRCLRAPISAEPQASDDDLPGASGVADGSEQQCAAGSPSFKQCHVGYAWDEPTRSRYSNHNCSSPDTAQLKHGAAKERKMNDSDERSSGKRVA